jgi:hypothetical protein
MSETFKTKLLFLLIIPVFLYVSVLHFIPLLEPDESRYSEIADTMIDTGNYITPHLNHVVYLEKPPLAFWVTTVMFRIFGENEFSARLFVGLCTWGCILLCYFMGSFLHDKKTGLYAAGVFTTFLYTFILGRINILDIPLSFFVCLATWAGYRHIIGNGQEKRWIYILYTSSALAFLTKGLIGILFPFAILILWLLISRKWRDIFKLFSLMGLILMMAIVSPWLVLVQMANKDFLWFFFVHEHLLRYATKIHGRYQAIYFYLPIVILGVLPWLAFLIQAIRKNDSNGYKSQFTSINGRFLIVWIAFILVFFSLSSSKLIPYIAPIFLPIAVIFGHLFRQYDDQPLLPTGKIANHVFYYLPILLQSLLIIAMILLPPFVVNRAHLGGDLMISHYSTWLWLILLPITIQILLIFLPRIVQQRYDHGWFLTVYFLSVLFFVSLILPASALITPYASAYQLAQAIKAHVPADQKIYQYKMFLYGIESYSDVRTPVVADFGEMAFGMNRLSSAEKACYFLTRQEFFQLCKERNGPVYCITKRKKNLDDLTRSGVTFQVIWSNNFYCLLRL